MIDKKARSESHHFFEKPVVVGRSGGGCVGWAEVGARGDPRFGGCWLVIW